MKYILLLLSLISFNTYAECKVTIGNYVDCGQTDYRNGSNSPKVYTQDGRYIGNLNNNKFDPQSISNPYNTQMPMQTINQQYVVKPTNYWE